MSKETSFRRCHIIISLRSVAFSTAAIFADTHQKALVIVPLSAYLVHVY